MKLIFNKGAQGRRGVKLPELDVPNKAEIPEKLFRKSPARLPEVSEMEVIRHFIELSENNFGVDTNFYPLGSCTMKYNPKIGEEVARYNGFTALHPLLPQLRPGGLLTQGALQVIYETEQFLSELTGMAEFTMQPLAGAHGELTGIMIIAAYHKAKGNKKTKVIIPDSAHGTNPASAAIAGYRVESVPSNEHGVMGYREFMKVLDNEVAAVMLTCPNTLGLFNPEIKKIADKVHEVDALMYCDGANLNAILGKSKPASIGFDLMHVNLHKTFGTPHGGGGPGAGPVGVKEKLKKFLPISLVIKRRDGTYALEYERPSSIGYVAPFYGNFGVILKAYTYILSLGGEGLKKVSENAVLNANYIKEKLKTHYHLPYDRTCMHECVFSASRQMKKGVHAIDIAKRLIDYGFHPPTVYFPLIVEEAMMIEPTETESKETIDAFIEAMIKIAEEAEKNPDLLHSAPVSTPISRLDETAAAREMDLRV
ncbi:MAG: aminomethyl-transferring glycine dehydrogenase subunit GcvPB [Candidatus Omnitrophica bacterium]|nr:aminomethyl-transferring glycine dehydrogenase subunit GcvPB [Candidatus Omnitrophota bacterium]